MNTSGDANSINIYLCSDLHLDFLSEEELDQFTLPDADAYLIAGDTMNGVKKELCDWVISKTKNKPTFIIPGNHEYYSLRRDKADRKLKSFFENTNVTVLLDSHAELLSGLAIYGTDYWTDMNLYNDQATAKRLGKSKMNDYHAITFKNQNSYRKLSPDNTIDWHIHAKEKLREFSEKYQGQYILMTHHGVFKECLSLNQDGSRGLNELDPLYTSDNETFIDNLNNKPILCINGHTHHFSNQKVINIPVISNPRGYKGSVASGCIRIEIDGPYKVVDSSLLDLKPFQVDQAFVYMWEELAGTLTRSGEDIVFQYNETYLENGGAPVSLSMPFRADPYVNPVRFKLLLDNDELAYHSKVTGYEAHDYLSILAMGNIDFPGVIDVRCK